MNSNHISKILNENIKKNKKQLSVLDLDFILSSRFHLNLDEYKDIFSDIKNIELLNLSYKDGVLLETIFMKCNKQHKKINLYQEYDFFVAQIEKANLISEISPFTLNNTLLNATCYNNLESAQYVLNSHRLPFKADISHFNYGCIYNAYGTYKKGKQDTFLYLVNNFDFYNNPKFIAQSKNNFKKNDNELNTFIHTINSLKQFKELKEELEIQFKDSSINDKVTKKNKI